MSVYAVSVVIVTWNVGGALARCLAALPAAWDDGLNPAWTWELIVVDNASTDDTVAVVQQQVPLLLRAKSGHPPQEVQFLVNPCNRLYTAAANQGLEAAQGRYGLVLNPDTVPAPGSLARLVALAEAHPRIGLLGPRILTPEGRDDLRTGRHYPTPWSELTDWLGLTRRFPRSRLWAANLRPQVPRTRTGPVPLLSGACLLLSASLPPELRRFDPGYPMYGEDVDLCRRIQAAGYETWLVAEAVIVHSGGLSSRQERVRTALLAADGVNRYFRHWHGPWTARRHRLGMAVVAALKGSAFSLLGRLGLEKESALQRHLHAGLWRWAWCGRLEAETTETAAAEVNRMVFSLSPVR
jgi:GT2 family glycosyltransferase